MSKLVSGFFGACTVSSEEGTAGTAQRIETKSELTTSPKKRPRRCPSKRICIPKSSQDASGNSPGYFDPNNPTYTRPGANKKYIAIQQCEESGCCYELNVPAKDRGCFLNYWRMGEAELNFDYYFGPEDNGGPRRPRAATAKSDQLSNTDFYCRAANITDFVDLEILEGSQYKFVQICSQSHNSYNSSDNIIVAIVKDNDNNYYLTDFFVKGDTLEIKTDPIEIEKENFDPLNNTYHLTWNNSTSFNKGLGGMGADPTWDTKIPKMPKICPTASYWAKGRIEEDATSQKLYKTMCTSYGWWIHKTKCSRMHM